MKFLTRLDIAAGIATGLTTGVIGWRVLVYLDKGLPLGIDPVVLTFALPVLWVLGVQLGYILGVCIKPFTQFGRFVCIGFANAMVDFGVLYIGIALTDVTAGIGYTLIKTCSFSIATVHSYLWNKYWAFDAGKTAANSREVSSFAAVSVVSLLVNVAIASAVVALRPASFAAISWAGIGAITGSAAAIIVSFTGFRRFVFKRK